MQTMHLPTLSTSVVGASRLLRRLLALGIGISALFTAVATHAAEGGTIRGSVSNTATGNMLEGARVEIPALALTVLTDGTGSYVFQNVPPGT